MKLTVLGCNGPYPAAGGACSGYLLSANGTNVLIDCGTGTLANLPKYLPWEALDAVVLSHLHYDHMSDLLPMQYALQFHPRQNPLPVYAPATPANVRSLLTRALRLFTHSLPATPANVRALLDAPCFALRPIEDVRIGEIEFRFHPGRHPVESFALRASCGGRTFAYTGDTNEVDGLDAFLSGADLLLADAGLSAADWRMAAPHLSAEGCAKLAERAGCARLLLTHLNPKYTPEELEAEARAIRPDAEFVRIGRQYDI